MIDLTCISQSIYFFVLKYLYVCTSVCEGQGVVAPSTNTTTTFGSPETGLDSCPPRTRMPDNASCGMCGVQMKSRYSLLLCVCVCVRARLSGCMKSSFVVMM